ncbi:MAG: glycosyltransferase family 2 protein [Betaproteobacteria bacterium]
MNLQGVAMVRNEADIVEAFVRHNLTRLDGLIVVDHGSADDTVKILVALAREGLPVSVLANAMPGYAQVEITTSAVRHAFARTAADFVFPLDADEFIKAPSRAAMERALAAIPPRTHGLMTWHTYLPDFGRPYRDVIASARGARRLPEERHQHGKVVVGRHFTTTPRAVIASGNHGVVPWHGARFEDLEPHHVIAAGDIAIAHLPFRNAPQFVAKTVIKRLARLAAGRDWSAQFDRREAYDHIVAGGALDAAFFRASAVNFNVAANRRIDAAAVSLVDDPFLADLALSHTPAEPADALPLVLAAVEQLALLEARARPPAA